MSWRGFFIVLALVLALVGQSVEANQCADFFARYPHVIRTLWPGFSTNVNQEMVLAEFMATLPQRSLNVVKSVEETDYIETDDFTDKFFLLSAGVFRALQLNVNKMREKRKFRRDGATPYATHPVRLAQLTHQIYKNKKYSVLAEEEEYQLTLIFNLLHDYFEEGDGVNLAAISDLTRILSVSAVDKFDFQHLYEIAFAPMILTEPVFDLSGVTAKHPQLDPKRIELVSFVIIAEAFIEQYRVTRSVMVRALANSILEDKIVNAFDSDHLDRIVDPVQRKLQRLRQLSLFYYSWTRIGRFAHPDVQRTFVYMLQSIADRAGIRFGEIVEYSRGCEMTAEAVREEVLALAAAFHAQMGVSEFLVP